jgi:ABC-type transporter Mla subunit MlaD
VKKLDETTSNMKAITDKTDTVLGENKKKIDETLENVKQITQNLKDLTEDLKKSPWKLIRKP